MRTNQLWAAAAVLLFAFVLSCSTSDQKEKASSQPSEGKSQDKTSDDPEVSPFESDSVTDLTVIQNMFAFPIEEDSSINFCGGLKNSTDPQRIRFTIYYAPLGKNPKKQAVFKIRGQDRYQFFFTAPAKGNMYLVMEEERGLAWKNLMVKEVQPVEEDDCCPGYGVKMLINRRDVESQGGTGSGGSSKVGQN